MNEENKDLNPVESEVAATQEAAPVQPEVSQQPVGGIVGDNVDQVSYVSNGTPMPKKKGPIGIIIGLVVILAVAALGYFVIYPMVNKKLAAKPVDSFNNSIDLVTRNINNTVEQIIKERMYFDANVTLESNMEGIKEFSGYTYNVNGGIDPKKKVLEVGASIDQDNQKLGAKLFYVNGEIFAKFSNYSDLILFDKLEDQEELQEINEVFAQYDQLVGTLSTVDADDSQYLVNLFGKLLKESIPEDKIVSEDATMDVLDDTVNVKSNKLTINTELAKNIAKHVCEGIKNDAKAMEILKSFGLEDPSQLFEGLDYDSIELENDIVITIYTLKDENVGYEITEGSDKYIYYKNNGNFVIEGAFVTNGEKSTLKVTGKKDGDKTNVSIKVDGGEIASLVVSKWSEKEIDLSYSISGAITGDFKYSLKEGSDKNEFHVEFKIDAQGQYVKVTADITTDWSSELPTVNTSIYKQLSDEELEKVLEEFGNALGQSPLFQAFQSLSGDMYYGGGYDFEDVYGGIEDGDDI